MVSNVGGFRVWCLGFRVSRGRISRVYRLGFTVMI